MQSYKFKMASKFWYPRWPLPLPQINAMSITTKVLILGSRMQVINQHFTARNTVNKLISDINMPFFTTDMAGYYSKGLTDNIYNHLQHINKTIWSAILPEINSMSCRCRVLYILYVIYTRYQCNHLTSWSHKLHTLIHTSCLFGSGLHREVLYG